MRNTIAVCMVRANEEFQVDSLRAICEQAKVYGLHVQVFNTFEELYLHNLNDEGEESIFERIDYDCLCGMILFCEKIKDNELNLRLIANCKKNGIPVVSVDRKMDDCYSITFAYANAFEEIVRHLITVHQCRSFFVMAGMRGNDFSNERIDAVRRVMKEYGMELKEEDIGYGDFWEEPCVAEMNRFLASGRPLPDAFISLNDSMAIAICEVLHKAGYRIPQDTIVTGFDGIEEERYNTPRLTTGRQDIAAGGRRAVDIIYKVSLQKEEVEKEYVIPFAISFSQSCGCMPIGENEASEKIHDLYLQLKGFRYFTKHMYEMLGSIAGTRSLEGVLDKLPVYLSYLISFQDIYFCVESSCLDAFDGLRAKVMEKNRELNGSGEIDMVLLGEWHSDEGFEAPLINFKRKELLPPEQKCDVEDRLMFIPLHEQDNVFGYLAVHMDPHRNDYMAMYNFSINLSHILDSVISHQKMQNFNARLKSANDKLEELYVHDPLTGIYNRRGFYQDIDRYIKRHNYGWIVVASVDLNGLKGINDIHGHGEGDFAIRTVGRTLNKCVAEQGICARFGGDEFAAVLFYDEYEQNAEKEFRRQLKKLLEEVNATEGKPYKITCSCGVEVTTVNQDTNIDELMKEADRKMYLDKKQFYESQGLSEDSIR